MICSVKMIRAFICILSTLCLKEVDGAIYDSVFGITENTAIEKDKIFETFNYVNFCDCKYMCVNNVSECRAFALEKLANGMTSCHISKENCTVDTVKEKRKSSIIFCKNGCRDTFQVSQDGESNYDPFKYYYDGMQFDYSSNRILKVSSEKVTCKKGSWKRDCPIDFKQHGHLCLHLNLSHTSTWAKGKSYCEEKGGYLAMTKGREDSSVLKKFFDDFASKSSQSSKEIYLGGSDLDKQNVWKWVDGTEQVLDDLVKWGISKQGRQPANKKGEDCLIYWPKYTDGNLGDDTCNNKFYSLCMA